MNKRTFYTFFVMSLLLVNSVFAQDMNLTSNESSPITVNATESTNQQETIVATSGFSIGDVIKNSPTVKTGVFFNLNDSKWQVLNSITLVQGTGKFSALSFDLGYADQEILAISANYDVISLEKLGVTMPILKNIVANVGWTAGFKRFTSSNEFVTGPEAVLKYQIKF